MAIVSALGYGFTTIASNLTSSKEIAFLEETRATMANVHTNRAALITDGNAEAAVIAGLPPDARGVIDADVVDCFVGNNAPSSCPEKQSTYFRLTRKTLRANGTLEPVSEH